MTEQATSSGATSFVREDQELMAHPQPGYAMMRGVGPVIANPGSATTTTRAATEAVLRHPELFSSSEAVDLGNIRPLIPLQVDPPDHVKYRRILDPLFAPKPMAQWEQPVTLLVNNLIDGFVERGECNFTDELAVPLPSQVFLTLVGMPLDDLALLLRLKDGIIRPALTPEEMERTNGDLLEAFELTQKTRAGAAGEIYDYFTAILEERTSAPQEDILSRFLATEIDGVRLSHDEILDICFLFLIAGLDTVTDSLTCIFTFLAQHPDHRGALVADPATIPSAVEELLRWESPVPVVVRQAAADCEVEGVPIKSGDLVLASLGSANTDPEFLIDADVVRFDRESNPHLAFGAGVHRCLGSHLARQELRIVLREWHRRIPEYEIKPGTVLQFGGGLRTVDNLILRWPDRR